MKKIMIIATVCVWACVVMAQGYKLVSFLGVENGYAYYEMKVTTPEGIVIKPEGNADEGEKAVSPIASKCFQEVMTDSMRWTVNFVDYGAESAEDKSLLLHSEPWIITCTEPLHNSLLCIAENNGCNKYPDPDALIKAGYEISVLSEGEGIIIKNDELTHLGICQDGKWIFTKKCPNLEMKKFQQIIEIGEIVLH